MTAPSVSILMPARDAAPHLESCLRSLARQTLTDYELVAVNDGSRDRSPALLDAWAARDPRARVVHRQASGLVATLNAGLEACRAPLVARMDADDISHPRRLELQAALLAGDPEVGVVSCRVRQFPWRRVGEGSRIYARWLDSLITHDQMARERFVEAPLVHPSAMVRRSLLVEAGGYRDLGWPEDYDLWLRLFEMEVRFAKVDRVLYFWREHAGRLTWSDPRYATDAFLRCKARFLITGPLTRASRVVVWGAGPTGRRLSRYLLEEGARIAAFVDIDPGKVGRTVRGRPVVAPEGLPPLLAPGTVVLAAVAARGGRELIRSRLEGFGLIEGESYWCVA